MSNYKSKHTGAQVDEAVSKVLNGDIEELSTIKSDILLEIFLEKKIHGLYQKKK